MSETDSQNGSDADSAEDTGQDQATAEHDGSGSGDVLEQMAAEVDQGGGLRDNEASVAALMDRDEHGEEQGEAEATRVSDNEWADPGAGSDAAN